MKLSTWDLDVAVHELVEVLFDVLVDDLSVHHASTDDDSLWGDQEGDVDAALGEVVAHDLPDVVVVWKVWEGCDVHSQSLCDGVVGAEVLDAVVVEVAWSWETSFNVLLMSLSTKKIQQKMKKLKNSKKLNFCEK